LIAIESGTKLRIWPKSHRLSTINPLFFTQKPIYPVDIELQQGDILVFRADLVHAGSSYEHENVSVHVFLDHDSVYRQQNRTWIVKLHASELLEKVIVEV